MDGLLAVTYRCNCRCQICHIWKYPTKKEEEVTVADLEKLPRMRFANITGGEPFLREDIEDIVGVVKSKARRVVISTNGLATEKIIKLAQSTGVGIRISIEGLSEANDRLRGVKGGFDRSLRTVIALKDMGLKDIGFGITVSDENVGDLLELYKLARVMNVEFATAAIHNSYYFHKTDNEIVDKERVAGEFAKLIREFFKSRKIKDWYRAYLNYGIMNYVRGGKRLLPCEAGTELFFLDPLGEIRPCNVMEETMGNIKEKSFKEIWNSPEARELREKVANCERDCWMVGSAAPAMKKYIWKPTIWILKNKWSKRDFSETL